MATIKKYNGSSWENAVVRKLGTSTDTITTLPADLYADGTNATVGLKGNMSQTGTPTPDNPIQPQETGERTGNLLKNEQTQTVVENNGITFTRNSDGSITANGTATARAKYQYYGLGAWKYAYDTDYFLSGCPTGGSTNTYSLLIDSTAMQFRDTGNGKLVNVPSSDTGTYNFEIRIESGATVDNLVFRPMLNSGTTPLPYEPYGYKIPISSANTTTNIYLGEVQTTRKIKKLVLTGNETCYPYSFQSTNGIEMINMLDANYQRTNGICSHYPVATTGSANSLWIGVNNKTLYFVGILDDLGLSSSTAFKQWLATQYANGTPVTVWYVLAKPETGTVNEPLRKIGDYADTVSGITIPTITGADSFDVQTTLKPSEVSLSYTGWHDATVREWDGSDWN